MDILLNDPILLSNRIYIGGRTSCLFFSLGTVVSEEKDSLLRNINASSRLMWVFKDQILQPSSFNFSISSKFSQFQYHMKLIKDARHFASAEFRAFCLHGELASNCGVLFPLQI